MIDLHMHSRYSDDGTYAPAVLAAKCAAQGISVISVTDHNCARANAEAQAAAKENGILYIPGIEIDCVCMGINLHVLGYGIDPQSEDFEAIEENVERQNFRASIQRLAATQALGFQVTEDEMWEIGKDSWRQGTWTGEMFAEVLLAKPEYADHPLLTPYRPGGARSDNPYVNFYWDCYSQGKPCYIDIKFPGMEEILETIHRNHGIAVLAHPGANLKGREYLLNEMLFLGIDGIEAFSSYHTPRQAAYFYQKAISRGLLVTCGSDFHGRTKPAIQLGGAVFAPGLDVCKEAERIGRELIDRCVYSSDIH